MTNQTEYEQKVFIADIAAGLYLSDRDGWTMQAIAHQAGLETSELFLLYPNKMAMLHFWYEAKIHAYRQMINEIEDFDELRLSDKLLNFLLSITDMFNENKIFVEDTFRAHVFQNHTWHPFSSEIKNLLKDFIEGDGRVSGFASIFLWDETYAFLSKEIMHFLLFWSRDNSERQEKSEALAMKLSAFIEDMLYNRMVDSGFDLAKFLWQEGVIKVDVNIPFIGRVKSGKNQESNNG